MSASPTSSPSLDDYVRLFRTYGEDIRAVFIRPDDHRYDFLFEQALRLLNRESQFNATLPAPFRITAKQYADGDPETVRHMKYPENSHFWLSDLYTFVMNAEAKAEGKGE